MSKDTAHDLSIVLPVFQPERARSAVERIAAAARSIPHEIIAVCSEKVALLLDGSPSVLLVETAPSSSYVRAVRDGLERATRRNVLLLPERFQPLPGSLERLVHFLSQQDELFLAGARIFDDPGVWSEQTVYGNYAPYTPCIRRDHLEAIGGFDPRYKSEPWAIRDLALRVWDAGGRAALCPDAWFRADERESIAGEEETFVRRWHDQLGDRVQGRAARDICRQNNFVYPGLPPGQCSELLRHHAWDALEQTLLEPIPITQLAATAKAAITHLPAAPTKIRADTLNRIAECCGIALTQETRAWYADRFAAYLRRERPYPYPTRPLTRNGALHPRDVLNRAALFLLTRDTSPILERYKDVDVLYAAGEYLTWPEELPRSSAERTKNSGHPGVLRDASLHALLSRFEGTRPERPLADLDALGNLETRLMTAEPTFELLEQCGVDDLAVLLLVCLEREDWRNLARALEEEDAPYDKDAIVPLFVSAAKHLKNAPIELALRFLEHGFAQLLAQTGDLAAPVAFPEELVLLRALELLKADDLTPALRERIDAQRSCYTPVCTHRGYSIVRYFRTYYAYAYREAFDPERAGQYISAATCHELLSQLDGAAVPVDSASFDGSVRETLIPDYRGFRIDRWLNGFFAFPASITDFSIWRFEDGRYPAAHRSRTLIGAKRFVDAHAESEASPFPWIERHHQLLKAMEPDRFVRHAVSDTSLVLPNYRNEWSILFANGLFYGWPRAAGRFDPNRFVNNEVTGVVVGTSLLETQALIDLLQGDSLSAWPEQTTHAFEVACHNAHKAAESAFSHRLTLDSLPRRLTCSTAAGCNLSCRMCHLRGEHHLFHRGRADQRSMSESVWQQVLEILPYFQSVLMASEGELLFHEDWFDRWLKTLPRFPNVQAEIQTNGMLLTKEVVDRILDAPFIGSVGISIDGATPATNDALRAGAKLSQITRNIEHLIAERTRRGLFAPVVVVHTVLQKDNIHEFPDLVQNMINLGVSGMSAGVLLAARREDIEESLYFHPGLADEMTRKAQEVARAAGRRLDLFDPFHKSATQRSLCWDPWLNVQILHDGSIYSCGNMPLRMGNIQDPGGFMGVWNNEKYQSLRRTVNTAHPAHEPCLRCSALLPTDYFESHIHTDVLLKLLEEGVFDAHCPFPVQLLPARP